MVGLSGRTARACHLSGKRNAAPGLAFDCGCQRCHLIPIYLSRKKKQRDAEEVIPEVLATVATAGPNRLTGQEVMRINSQ